MSAERENSNLWERIMDHAVRTEYTRLCKRYPEPKEE